MLVRHVSTRILTGFLTVNLLVLPAFLNAAPPAVTTGSSTAGTVGTIISDDTLVRSGDDKDKYYATNRLNKGDHVTVMGEARNGFLQIVPPAGSFCFVAKSYVTKADNSNTATVSQPDIRIRAGSQLLDKKYTVLRMSMNVGDTLQVIGEEKEYFKVVPPPGAYFWVEQSAVDLTAPPAPAAAATPVVATPAPVIATPAPAPAPAVGTAKPASSSLTTLTPAPASTQPAEVTASVPATTRPADVAVAVAPTTAPAEPTAQERFDDAEAQFATTTGQPLDQQPIESLTSQYTALSTDGTLPPSEHRIVAVRLATLKVRGDARQQYNDALKMQADATAKRQAQVAEQTELAEKIKQDAVTMYAAVGTLRTSALTQSGTTLYRICDPSSGHTLVYVRTNDPKYAALLNQFVGVKGDVAHDDQMNLKYITPTAGEKVDQTKVGTTIAATITPPSMVSKTATASTGNQ
jgi:hypothetical protein